MYRSTADWPVSVGLNSLPSGRPGSGGVKDTPRGGVSKVCCLRGPSQRGQGLSDG
jgi:hypothetical protein